MPASQDVWEGQWYCSGAMLLCKVDNGSGRGEFTRIGMTHFSRFQDDYYGTKKVEAFSKAQNDPTQWADDSVYAECDVEDGNGQKKHIIKIL